LKGKQQTILQKYSLYAQHDAIERLVREEIISNEVAEQERESITNKLVKLEDAH
jgi:monovalent cation:H+ antiporter, CPA1 family